MPHPAVENKICDTATKLALIAKRSIQNPQEKFTSLKHLLNEEYLYSCYKELKSGKAAGIDGITKESYTDESIASAIKDIIVRMKANRYYPKPARRIFIKKANGKQRPLGIPTVIDKVVQLAIKKILEAIYEPHFLNSSYGFRPNRNCHQALKAVHKMVMTKPINWIIDVDIKGFFDNVDHHWMIECLQQRISDPRFKTLIIKFLKAGVISEGKYNKTEKGTPQGGILSPLLANIYLHYALDIWFEKVEKKKIKGWTQIIRYADDFIIGAQTKTRSVNNFNHQTKKLVFKWMNRRSQKQSFNWEEFNRYTKLYPLPKPSLVFNMYDIW